MPFVKPTPQKLAAVEAFREAVATHGVPFAIEFLTRAVEALSTCRLRGITRSVLRTMDAAKTPNGEAELPTELEPGSKEKLALMELRLAAGYELHHREDRRKLASPLPRFAEGPRRRGRGVKDDAN